MQVRLDEAEAAALKGGKRMIAKLEQRVRYNVYSVYRQVYVHRQLMDNVFRFVNWKLNWMVKHVVIRKQQRMSESRKDESENFNSRFGFIYYVY